jgi:transposase
VRHLRINRLYGDGAYDAEEHHRLCRKDLGIASTVIPVNPRSRRPRRPQTHDRQQMYSRFPKRLYGRRWHAESTISQHKRKLGSALRGRTPQARESECLLRVITHNLMILRRAG